MVTLHPARSRYTLIKMMMIAIAASILTGIVWPTMNIFSLILLTCPLIVAGILHMVLIRLDLLPWLKIPVQSKLFGKNKTWRGFVVMPILGILSMYLFSFSQTFISLLPQQTNLSLLGAALCFSYVLFELPNSWVKRKLGIGPGEQSDKHQVVFFICDRIDSAIGCALTYYFFGVDISIFWIVPLALLIHPMVTIPLYLLGIKKSFL